MIKRKKLKDYSPSEINKALYCDKIIAELWKSERYELNQLFAKHSNNKLDIPQLWTIVVLKFMKNIIATNPNIYINFIKEKSGKIEISIFPLYIESVQQQIIGATLAIDVITLTQVELFERTGYVKK